MADGDQRRVNRHLLHYHFIEDGKFIPEELGAIGWYDFYKGAECRACQSEAELARKAYIELLCADNFRTHFKAVVSCVLGYLIDETGIAPSRDQILELGRLSLVDQPDFRSVSEWFIGIYGA